MIRIVQLSDSHFGTTNAEKTTALVSVVKDLKPDLILLSGDITQRARVSEFIQARDLLESLAPTPIISTPGNHDISLLNFFERLFFPYRRYKNILRHPAEGKWKKDGVEVVCLNSTSRFRHTDGYLNALELTRLNSPADDTHFRMAVFHHPMDCAKPKDEENIVKNAQAIAEKLQATQIDLVVGGHVHDPFVTLSTRKYKGRAFVISVAGTCLSYRTRSGAPNSFSVYDISRDAFEAHRFDLKPTKDFQKVSTVRFVKNGDEWSSTSPSGL